MTSLPMQCAEMRADLVERVVSDHNERVMRFMITSAARSKDRLFPPNYNSREAVHDIRTIAKMSELFTVTDQMLDLVMYAARSMPPQALQREHLPSQDGFLWFPKPLNLVDIRGARMPVRALMWHEASLGGREEYGESIADSRRGLLLHVFVLNGQDGDALMRQVPPGERGKLLAKMPHLGLAHVQGIGFGKHMWNPDAESLDLSPDERARVIRQLRNLQDGEVVDDSLDEKGTYLVRTSEGHELRLVPDRLVQFLSAYLHFYRSELAGHDREFASRSAEKWLRRLGLDNSPITVLRLRRRAPGKETGRGTPLSYRYVRRGHWRRQPHGPRANPSYEYIWIAPTLVGDDDLPLRKRDVVNTLVR